MPQDLTNLPSRLRRVLVGEPVRLGAVRGGEKLERIANVMWTFYALRDNERTQLAVIERPFSGNRASAIWEATGPDERRERSVRVVYTVKAGAVERDAGEEIEVFVPWLEITAVDEQGAPVVNAPFRLVYDGVPQGGDPFRTDDQGKRRIEEVPPCDVTVEWLAPHRAIRWEGNATLPRRKVVLARYRAKIVWPDVPEGGLHKQWVNEKQTDGLPVDSSTQMRIRVAPQEGTAPNQPYWVKLVYAENECLPRTGGGWAPDQPGFEKPGPGVFLIRAVLNGESLGAQAFLVSAGLGDVVTVHVGSTPECLDAQVRVQSWARRPVLNDSRTDLPAPVLGMVQTAFRACFYEVSFDGRVDLPARRCVFEVPGDWLGEAGLMGRSAAGRYRYVNRGMPDHDAIWRTNNEKTRLLKFDGFYMPTQRAVDITLRSATGSTRINVSPGKVVFPKNLSNGEDFFTAKTTIDGAEVTVPLKATIEADGRAFTLSLADPAAWASRIGLFSPLRANLTITELYLTAGSAGSNTAAVLHLTSRRAEDYAWTVCHELAHLFGIVREKPLNGAFDIPRNPHYVLDRGFQGGHCTTGIPADKLSAADYNLDLHLKGTYGECIMWGSLRAPTSPVPPPVTFCPTCQKLLRANV